jgi:hypothetical protein
MLAWLPLYLKIAMNRKQLILVFTLAGSLAMHTSFVRKPADSYKAPYAKQLKIINDKAEIAFTVTEKDLIPEGLAYNPADKSFFISSIHKHKIVRILSDGRCEDFTFSRQDGLGEILGMKIDAVNQHLWACSNEVENGVATKSMIHQYNLTTKKLIQKSELNEKGHLFNDLDFANGRIFITDSDANSIYIVSDENKLQFFFKDEKLKYCNGLAFNSSGTKLFISSFTGLYSLDTKTKKLERLRLPGYHLFGIDGLYLYKKSLVGIQNTSFPESVNQYFFNENQDGFSAAKNLVAADRHFNVPTTGAIVNDWFYFIANSQMDNLEMALLKTNRS